MDSQDKAKEANKGSEVLLGSRSKQPQNNDKYPQCGRIWNVEIARRPRLGKLQGSESLELTRTPRMRRDDIYQLYPTLQHPRYLT